MLFPQHPGGRALAQQEKKPDLVPHSTWLLPACLHLGVQRSEGDPHPVSGPNMPRPQKVGGLCFTDIVVDKLSMGFPTNKGAN